MITYILAVISIVYVLKYSSLFAVVNRMISLIPFPPLQLAWSCPACLSFWVGIGIAIINQPLHIFKVQSIDIIVAGLICHFVMAFVSTLISWFQRR